MSVRMWAACLAAGLTAASFLGSCHEGEASDPCIDVTCSGHGTCFDDGARALCECDSGYRSEGTACVPVGSDGDSDADSDTDTDADADTDTDADADADADADGDADEETDAEVDGDGDAGGPCPTGMVLVAGPPAFCIDGFEASARSAGRANSVAGVLPWASVTLAEAASACVAAGKRLCTDDEWQAACSGPGGLTFPFGTLDDYATCECNDMSHGVGAAALTGASPECEGAYSGLFDMAGNVTEWTSTCATGECIVHGGSYLSSSVLELRCFVGPSVPATEAAPERGFRCCRDM